jgi:hypothetical protein
VILFGRYDVERPISLAARSRCPVVARVDCGASCHQPLRTATWQSGSFAGQFNPGQLNIAAAESFRY